MIKPILKLLGSDYSLGMITYVRRFEKFFKPIVHTLEKYFPDVEKNYVLNGHYDTEANDKFLKDAKAFLKTTSAQNVVAYQENQCISKCWNQLVLHSKAPKVLILSDDITIGRLFRPFFEAQEWMYPAFTINNTWSYYVISKDIIRKVGWFEERFPANGQEDGDYALRMALAKGKSVMPKLHDRNIYCFGINNLGAKNEDPGWKKYSASFEERYASANTEFFNKKWEKSKEPLEGGVYAFNEAYFRIRPGMETPKFHDYLLLDNPLTSSLK